MNTLSIDTALRTCSIGVMRDGDIIVSKIELMPRGQDQALAVVVQEALTQANLKPKNLSAIAVTTGPGSFTGIRVGMAFARGMAAVLNVPLIGMTTAEVLAQQVKSDQDIAVVIEIKKDAYIAQIFNQGQAQTELIPLDQEGLIKFIEDRGIETVVTHSENITAFLNIPSEIYTPDPSIMLKIAHNGHKTDQVVRPVYIRQADVTIQA